MKTLVASLLALVPLIAQAGGDQQWNAVPDSSSTAGLLLIATGAMAAFAARRRKR